MRNLKILLTVAAAGVLFTSCYERQFTPTLGSTPVEFVSSTIDTTLNSSTIRIPVHMTEQSGTGAKATLVFTGGTVTMKSDGSTREVVEFTNDQTGYENGGDILITSYDLYIGPYDEDEDGEDGLPTNSFEILVPDYLTFESMTLNFELKADNLGSNATLTYTATAPTEVDFTGMWNIGGGQYQITLDETGTGYYIYTKLAKDPFTGSRSGNNLTINTTGPQLDTGAEYGVVTLGMFAYHEETAGDGKFYLWPNENCVWSFGEDGASVTLTNGMFIGFPNPDNPQSYIYFGDTYVQENGTTGSRM